MEYKDIDRLMEVVKVEEKIRIKNDSLSYK